MLCACVCEGDMAAGRGEGGGGRIVTTDLSQPSQSCQAVHPTTNHLPQTSNHQPPTAVRDLAAEGELKIPREGEARGLISR